MEDYDFSRENSGFSNLGLVPSDPQTQNIDEITTYEEEEKKHSYIIKFRYQKIVQINQSEGPVEYDYVEMRSTIRNHERDGKFYFREDDVREEILRTEKTQDEDDFQRSKLSQIQSLKIEYSDQRRKRHCWLRLEKDDDIEIDPKNAASYSMQGKSQSMLIDNIPITVDLRAYFTIDQPDEEKAKDNSKDDVLSQYQSAKSEEALEGLFQTQEKLKKQNTYDPNNEKMMTPLSVKESKGSLKFKDRGKSKSSQKLTAPQSEKDNEDQNNQISQNQTQNEQNLLALPIQQKILALESRQQALEILLVNFSEQIMQQLRPNVQPQVYTTSQGPVDPVIPNDIVENPIHPPIKMKSHKAYSVEKKSETLDLVSNDESELQSDEDDLPDFFNLDQPSLPQTKSVKDFSLTSITPTPPRSNHRNSVQPQHQDKNIIRRRMDIDFCQLYANPLMQFDQNNNAEPFAQPLDCFYEFEKFINVFKATGRQISVKREIGTLQTLHQCISDQYSPKILHISCHGIKITNKMMEIQRIALALEPSSGDNNIPIGFCHYVKEDLIIERFKNFKNLKTKCVFISACHSERIGNILKILGIPIVIAINSSSEVEDQAAREFAEEFYRCGMSMSVEEAFQQSINRLKTAIRDLSYCCCKHTHETYCGWVQNLVKNMDKKAAHEIHDPLGQCNCEILITEQERLNTHFSDCRFVKKFNKQIKTFEEKYMTPQMKAQKEEKKNRFRSNLPQNKEDHEEKKEFQDHSKSKSAQRQKEVVCCCKADEPHDEFNKFKFISIKDVRPESMSEKEYQEILSQEQHYLKQRLFTEEELQRISYGDVIVTNNNPSQNQMWDHLEQIENQGNLLCRNVQIQKIVDLIQRSKWSSKKLIHIYGQSKNGKRDLVNFACRYALDGRVKDFKAAFSVEIQTIEEKAKKKPYSQHSLLKAIMNKFREYKDITDEQQFNTEMKKGKFIFVIDQCQRFIHYDRLGFQEGLIGFLKQYHDSLIILITRDQDDFNSARDKWESLEILKPSKEEALKIILKVVQERKQENHDVFSFKNEIKQNQQIDYPNHRFFQFKNRVTQEIIKFARQMDLSKTLIDNLNDLSLQRDKNKEQIEQFSERSKFLLPKLKEMRDQNLKINHLHLFILGLMQPRKGGLLSTDLEELFQILQLNHFQNGYQMTWGEFMKTLENSPASRGEFHHLLLQHQDSDYSNQQSSEFFRIQRIMDSRDYRYIPSEDLCSLIQNGEFEELYRQSFSASECYQSQLLELGEVFNEVIIYMNKSIKKIVEKNIHNFIERDNLKYIGISLDKGFLRSLKSQVNDNQNQTDPGFDQKNEEQKSEIYKLDHIYLANVLSLLNLNLLSRFFKLKEGIPQIQEMHKSHSHPHKEEEKKQKSNLRLIKEEFQEPQTQIIEELCINTLTQLIGNQDYVQAREIIKEGIKIGNKFKIYSLRGKLLLIQAGLDLEEKRIYDQVNLQKYQDIKSNLQDALTCLGSDYHLKNSRNQHVWYLEYLLELQRFSEKSDNYMPSNLQQVIKQIAQRLPSLDNSQELIRYKYMMLHIKQQSKTSNSSKKYRELLKVLCDLQNTIFYGQNLREQLKHAQLAALIKFHIAQLPGEKEQEEEKKKTIVTSASKRNDNLKTDNNEMRLKMLHESLNHLGQAFQILRQLKQCLTVSQYVKRKYKFKCLQTENLSLINELEIDKPTDIIYLLASNPIYLDDTINESALIEPAIQLQDKLEHFTKTQKKLLEAAEQHGFSSLVIARQIKRDTLNQLAKSNPCKILYLEQEHFLQKDSLVVVNDQGSALEYSLEYLSMDYDHLKVDQLPFELLILAFPGSQDIAETIFRERMQSGYIICFAQPNFIDATEDQAFILMQRIINSFCRKVVENLMERQHSLYQIDCSFADIFYDMINCYYQPKFQAQMTKLIKHKEESSLNDSKIGYDMSPLDRQAKEDMSLQNQRPILFTGKFSAPQFCLNKPPQADQIQMHHSQKDNKYKINYIDNLDRPLSLEPMVGRKEQVYQLLYLLSQNTQIIQINGEKGVGKKFFIRRALKYYYDLQAFDDPVKIGFMPAVSQIEHNFLKDIKQFCYQLKQAQLRENFKMIVVIEDFWERLGGSYWNEDSVNDFLVEFLWKIEHLTLILISTPTEANNLFHPLHQYFVHFGNCIVLHSLDL